MKLSRPAMPFAAAVLAVGVTTTAPAAASPPSEPSESAESAESPSGDTVEIQLTADAETLDPHTARSSFALQVSAFLYDTLTSRVDDETVSGLATSWEVEADRAVFTIRDDATCADGTPITPSVIKASFERLMDPETAAPYAVKELGYRDATFVADDAAGTFTIELPGPFSDLLHNSSHPSTGVVCPSGLENPEALADESHGSGPFVVDEVARGDHFVLLARDGYSWGPDGAVTGGARSPAEVRFVVIDNPTTAANLLLAGDLDIAVLEGAERERVSDSGDFHIHEGLANVETLLFNHAEGHATAAAEVRLAVSQAVDRDSYAAVRTDGFGEAAPSYLSPASSCFAPATEALPAFDIDAARETLEAAGWQSGDGGIYEKDGDRLHLRMLVTEQASAELTQQLLQEAGIEVELVTDPAATQEAFAGTGDWDLMPVPFGDHSTPSSFYAYFGGAFPPDGPNFAHISSEQYQQLGEEALATIGDDRCTLWHDAELALLEDSHVLPLASIPNAAIGNGVEFRRIQYLLIDPTSLLLADG